MLKIFVILYTIFLALKNFDKLILSSGKFSSVNKIIKPYFKKKTILKKYKTNLWFNWR